MGMTRSIARELSGKQVTANCVAPGYIRTSMTAKIPEEVQKKVLERIPLSRFGEVADVAGVCLFLASPAADYITGQTITVDGGMVMA